MVKNLAVVSTQIEPEVYAREPRATLLENSRHITLKGSRSLCKELYVGAKASLKKEIATNGCVIIKGDSAQSKVIGIAALADISNQ